MKQGHDSSKLKIQKTCSQKTVTNSYHKIKKAKLKDNNGYNLASSTEISIQNTLRKVSAIY